MRRETMRDGTLKRWGVFSIVVAIGLVVCAGSASATVVYFDDTFSDTDWDLTSFVFDGGQNLTTITASQQLAGGNLGAFRKVNHVLAGAFAPGEQSQQLGFHRNLNAIYDPGVLGAIASLNYSEDAICLDNTQGPACQATSVALIQGGKVYGANSFLITPDFQWTPKALSGLQQNNFSLVSVSSHTLLDFTQHPDFSATGSAIDFGFLRANSTCVGCGTGFTFFDSAGIDNWRVSIEQVSQGDHGGSVIPEPSSLFLLGSGLFGLAGWRRRRTSRTA